MWRYLMRRAIVSLPVLLLVSILTFFGSLMIPGDDLTTFYGAEIDANITADQITALRHQYGLDKPAPVRYVNWLGRVVQGDFGTSLRAKEPVIKLVHQKLSVSIWFTSITLLFNLTSGIGLGMVAGMRPGGKVDMAATSVATMGVATPNFWLAILLILLFSLKLGWFPSAGWVSPLENPAEAARHMVLPVLALGLFGSASIMRQTRASFVEVMTQDYIRTARAKGVAQRNVVVRHALRNALVPVVTIAAFQVAGLVSGSVLVERVFAIPGIGRLAVDATQNRDFPVIQAIVLLSATSIVVANFLADVAYSIVDPRIRYT
jgi:peptide/nickel transport system permease protein